MKSIPRNKIDATNPAKSPTTPPPKATISDLRSMPLVKISSQISTFLKFWYQETMRSLQSILLLIYLSR
jgi:hypothetical protein